MENKTCVFSFSNIVPKSLKTKQKNKNNNIHNETIHKQNMKINNKTNNANKFQNYKKPKTNSTFWLLYKINEHAFCFKTKSTKSPKPKCSFSFFDFRVRRMPRFLSWASVYWASLTCCMPRCLTSCQWRADDDVLGGTGLRRWCWRRCWIPWTRKRCHLVAFRPHHRPICSECPAALRRHEWQRPAARGTELQRSKQVRKHHPPPSPKMMPNWCTNYVKIIPKWYKHYAKMMQT